jgi:hypothetical protein
MPTTTFAGPVKAGGISTSTGNILGENVANQGFAKMVQVAAVTEVADDPSWTDIVIPANSQIVRIAVLVAIVFVNQIDIGRDDAVASDIEYFVNDLNATSLGLVEALGARVTTPSVWKDVGDVDVHLTFNSTVGAGDTGVGTLIVEYIQNRNLT